MTVSAEDEARSAAIFLCAQEFDRVADAMLAEECLVQVALSLALGRRLARSMRESTVLAAALIQSNVAVMKFATLEYARLEAAEGR